MAKAETKKTEQAAVIKVSDRAAAQLRNYAKRRKDRAIELRKQARDLMQNQSAEEKTGIGWLALALDVPDDWEYDSGVGCFQPPKVKKRK